ncbi:MAG: tetratricopeptide repeat protein, partial [Thermoanaerobaculia bacterium]|nr:tetratricopeptide repeat protein [Thermoanaerobaculia bacterium]
MSAAPPDTHRVSLLVDLAWEINETQTEEAALHLRDAIALAQKLKFTIGEAKAWNGLGIVEEIRGNYSTAYQYYQKALDLRQQTGDLSEISSSLNNIGVFLETTGHFDSALVYHRRNLEMLQTLGDTVRMARAHFNIAGVCQEMGEYLKAQESLNEARAILEMQKD